MTPAQCRAARALLNLEQAELALACGIARSTLADFEREARQPRQTSLNAIKHELEAKGVEFIEPNGGGAGVRLKIHANR
ncbi:MULTISPECIES: helix-turn-helix transcriptional regulator [unclassified Yoonia]|uniref:helix-turn-helix domain-containing protein n=1 Tax=unclassified Yoonia TaxID=2629118 RepID=UPI002AFFF722|nr:MULTISPECIES: helix-turn-helix transcriptional regulator [unclassified Yoonia]